MGEPGQDVLRAESSPLRTLRVAMIDQDPTSRQLMRHWLQNSEYRVSEVATRAQLDAVLESAAEIICMDLAFDDGRGLALLKELRTSRPELMIIALGTARDAETAVAAMRAGAADYVTKPLDATRIKAALERVRKSSDLTRSANRLSEDLAGRTLKGPLGGHTPAARDLDALVGRVVTRDVAVCLQAERGSGEGLIARAIHEGSARRHGPFVELDCAALAVDEQERGLFGEVRPDKSVVCGAFERASGGVVFLRQVGALSARVQALLTQVLSEKVIRRAFGHDSIAVNARVIASHDTDLRELVDEGKFREELYFRLVVYPVRVPPLRERRDDIPVIVSHFLRQLAPESRVQMSHESLESLMRYSWPGNLRELENVVHRGLLKASGETIELGDLPEEVRDVRQRESGPASSRRDPGLNWANFPEHEVIPLRELEKRAIEHALRVTGGSVSVAAQKLGIGRATLYRRIASLDLSQNVA